MYGDEILITMAACSRSRGVWLLQLTRGYEKQYATPGPAHGCSQWFREARFGLFIHYGLYSLLGRHEWVQYRKN